MGGAGTVHNKYFLIATALLVAAGTLIALLLFMGGGGGAGSPSPQNSTDGSNVITPEVPPGGVKIPPSVKKFAEKLLAKPPYPHGIYDEYIDASGKNITLCEAGAICNSYAAIGRARDVLKAFNITGGYTIDSVKALHLPSTNMYDWSLMLTINNTTWHIVVNSYTGSVTNIDIPLTAGLADKLGKNVSRLLPVLLGANYTEIYGQVEIRSVAEKKYLLYQKYRGLYIFNYALPPGTDTPCSGYIYIGGGVLDFVFIGYPAGLMAVYEPDLSVDEIDAEGLIAGYVYSRINTSDVEIEVQNLEYIGKEIYVYSINISYIVYTYNASIIVKTNTNIYITIKTAIYNDMVLDYMVIKH